MKGTIIEKIVNKKSVWEALAKDLEMHLEQFIARKKKNHTTIVEMISIAALCRVIIQSEAPYENETAVHHLFWFIQRNDIKNFLPDELYRKSLLPVISILNEAIKIYN